MDFRITPQSCHIELRKARERAGMSQRELQLRTGLRQAHVSRIENGQVDPRFSNVVRVARAVGLEVLLVPRRALPAVFGALAESGTDSEYGGPSAVELLVGAEDASSSGGGDGAGEELE
ncbi:MAG: helix-turn-helix transcriptional regulator [Gammaproteobacteria bacterium]|nr:helix-turn-helix transcriptional regulator [Gammaproteobacteria bacterium]